MVRLAAILVEPPIELNRHLLKVAVCPTLPHSSRRRHCRLPLRYSIYVPPVIPAKLDRLSRDTTE
jgi:hypothetical protein